MHKLHALKDMLIDELEKYGDKNDMSPGDLAVVDTLAHAAKNLCRVIDSMDDGSSGRYYPDMRSYRRDRMGRYSAEDYSRAAGDVIAQLEGMLDAAPDERSRTKIHELIREMKHV